MKKSKTLRAFVARQSEEIGDALLRRFYDTVKDVEVWNTVWRERQDASPNHITEGELREFTNLDADQPLRARIGNHIATCRLCLDKVGQAAVARDLIHDAERADPQHDRKSCRDCRRMAIIEENGKRRFKRVVV